MNIYTPQIISIYYRVTPLEAITVPIRQAAFDFDEAQMAVYREKGEIETFRFIPFEIFSEEVVTLPIDKIVSVLVKERY